FTFHENLLVKRVGVNTKTTNTTLTTADSIVLVNNPADVDITLPLALGSVGRYYTIKKTNANSYTVSIKLSGTDVLDGDTSAYVLTTPWQYAIVASDGSGWYIVGGH
ncbi:MAG: hypothetical protein AABZ14_01400, partial [Candidatus Margulisiibacteriota bacterium]